METRGAQLRKKSINQSDQKENNLAVVIRELLTDGNCTRVKLSEVTGLTQASITKIIFRLIEWNLVSECESVGSGIGRKAVRLRLNAEKYRVVAVRINRGYLAASIYDMQGEQYDMIRSSVSEDRPVAEAIARLVDMVRTVISHSDVPVLGIGAAVPGPFNYFTGEFEKITGFSRWEGINLGRILEDAFQMPAFVDQDANCGALAEIWHSDIKPDTDMVFVAATRGIGAGLYLDSHIYHGRNGFAGELGHTSINMFGPICECGNRGCIEAYASTLALENLYRHEAFDSPDPPPAIGEITSGEILKMVREGDPLACHAYKKTISYLCFGMVGVINTFNPDTIVFADEMASAGDVFLRIANDTFKKYLMPEFYDKLRIKICNLDGDPMLLGASVLAFEQMLKEPSLYFQKSDSPARR